LGVAGLAISVPSLAAEAVPPHTGLPIDADDQNQQKDGRLHRSDPAEQAGQVCGPAVSTWLRPRACTRAVRLPGVDDTAVSAIRFGGNHRRLDDADGLDRCHHNASACGEDFDWRIRSGFSFQSTRVNLHDLHGICPYREGAGPALCRPFLFPSCLEDTSRTAERPDSGNCGRASLLGRTSGAASSAKDKRPGLGRRRLNDSVSRRSGLRRVHPSCFPFSILTYKF
jgi:hypothetical protein